MRGLLKDIVDVAILLSAGCAIILWVDILEGVMQ